MCLIVFTWQPGHAQPLVLAANRDEFHARPTAPLSQWQECPGVYAGRDLEAGGTWLGIGPNRRIAALTNIRQPGQPPTRRSRGDLVAGFLTGNQSIDDYLQAVTHRLDEYAGFNLLLGDGQRLCYLHSAVGTPEYLSAGTYGLSNAGLDTPWPKLVKARQGLEALGSEPAALLEMLADPVQAPEHTLPDTGVGLATERLLSSVFITGASYGTRASTVVIVDAEGRREMIEHSFGPLGSALGEVHLHSV